MANDTYPIEVAGVKRDLRLFAIKPGVRIAILNILGDTELVSNGWVGAVLVACERDTPCDSTLRVTVRVLDDGNRAADTSFNVVVLAPAERARSVRH